MPPMNPKTKPKSPTQREHDLKTKEMKLQHGLLGWLFGSNENVPNYIIGTVTLMLVFGALVYTFVFVKWPNSTFTPSELWQLVLPVVTGILGYIFGSNKRSKVNEDE